LNSDRLNNFIKAVDFIAIVINSIFAIILLFDPSVIYNVRSYAEYTTGPIFNYYTAYVLLLFVTLIAYMGYQYKHADKDSRKKFLLISLGLAFVMVVATIVGYVLPAYGISQYNLLDSASSIFFVLAGVYSIARNKFLDVKTFATEIISYIILVLMFVLVFVGRAEISLIIRIILFGGLIYGVVTLIRSVHREIQQKEQLQDLTAKLEQANAHLKELDKMKTEFVSLASHELLTPVSAIEGYLSMLLDEKLAKVEDPTAKRYLDNIYKSAKRLARLIADMLNISRIEEGRLLVEKKEAEVAELIRQVIDEIRFKAEERKQKVVFEATDKYPTFVDPDKIKEVAVNIIGNSIKYSRNPGTIVVTLEKVPTAQVKDTWCKIKEEIKHRPLDDQEAIKSAIDPRMRQLVGENQYLIQVKDQGVGIPKEELPRLFKKFHRIGNYSTQESQGTGLGLYISRALVELNHGRIWADSEGEGKGSTFSFSLPELLAKSEIEKMEAEVPKEGNLKPLARPTKQAEEI